MARPSSTALLSLAVLAACRPRGGTAEDAAQVRSVRDRFFAAISAYDSASVRGTCTPDYVLIEDGLIWNLDSLLNTVSGLKADRLRIEYGFQDEPVRVEGAAAWMTYRNRGILRGERGADTLHWVESALFRKHDGAWRMALLHSTRIRRSQ